MNRSDLLYGIHPILEALRSAEWQIEGIYLQHGRKGREIDEVLSLAKTKRVTIDCRPKEARDRLKGEDHHQGAVGMVAARAYVSCDAVMAGVAATDHPWRLI